jgi:hypothetical protein
VFHHEKKNNVHLEPFKMGNVQLYPLSEIIFHAPGEDPDPLFHSSLSFFPIMDKQLSNHFTILSTEQLLICNTCRFAVSSNYIPRHLSEFHIWIPRSTRQELSYEARALNFPDPSMIPIPETPIPMIPCLDIKNGVRCTLCFHLAGTLKSIKQHYQTNHRIPGTLPQRGIPQGKSYFFPFFSLINLLEKFWEEQLVQSWTPGRAKRFFPIFIPAPQQNDPRLQNDPPSLDDTINDLLQRANLQDEQNEAILLLTRNQILNDQGRGQNSPWLTRTKWKVIGLNSRIKLIDRFYSRERIWVPYWK